MTPAGSASVWSVYRRLLGYARPYKAQLTIGILAGLIAGGSVFGLLKASPGLILPFEQGASVAEEGDTAPSGAAHGLTGSHARAVEWLEGHGIPVVREDGRMTWQVMVLAALGLPLLVLLRGLGTFLNRYYMRWVGSSLVRDLRDGLFDHLQHQSLKFFGQSDVGQLISRSTNDTNVVEQTISGTIADAVRAPIEVVAALVFVISFSMENELVRLVGWIGLLFPLCIIPIVVLGRFVRRYTRRALTRISDLVSRMHENLTGITVVKAFHMEAMEAERFRGMNNKYFRNIIRALRAELLMSPLVEVVAVMLVVVFAVVCYARDVKLYQIIPVGLAAVVIYRPIKLMARINTGLQRGAAALERIFELLDTDERVREADVPVVVDAFKERLVFDQVDFSYQADGDPLLRQIDIDIPVGSVVALVGETGSGKSTLANLVARFYDPTGGRILLDGVDLREIEIASLRRLVGLVSQHTVLFNETIAYNIAYGSPDATREEIEEAARMANAHDFILADRDGYERVVGEKGFLLSGGERQRIAIARAILRNPPILILDEATSALDTVTERLVQDAINKVMEGRTVFAIAHRLSTVRHADQILLIDGGRVAERGTHDELLAADGRYKALCDMQMLG